jgi:apolipoprotein D and lipocalin family protein
LARTTWRQRRQRAHLCEIAKLPDVFPSACASDTVARDRVRDDGVSVRNRCRRADGFIDAIEGSAAVVPGAGGARLEVTLLRRV